MNRGHLNEHDANQGAQSKGEFLGMAGNSAWYLLGAVGATQLLVVVLWGMLHVPLLVCLLAGLGLCLLAVTYVLALKNNRPSHYDTDFFESALIEAGVMALAFGPRGRRPSNPFRSLAADNVGASQLEQVTGNGRRAASRASGVARSTPAQAVVADSTPGKPTRREEPPETVPLADYERLQGELTEARDQLEEVMAGHEEERS